MDHTPSPSPSHMFAAPFSASPYTIANNDDEDDKDDEEYQSYELREHGGGGYQESESAEESTRIMPTSFSNYV